MEGEKVFKYKGKTVEELQNMSVEDFSKIIPSRLRRKIKRGFTEQEKILLSNIEKGAKNIKTHCRDMIVLPIMIDKRISIYNGKEFISINILPEMIAMRFGELVPTRKIAKHTTIGAKKSTVRK